MKYFAISSAVGGWRNICDFAASFGMLDDVSVCVPRAGTKVAANGVEL